VFFLFLYFSVDKNQRVSKCASQAVITMSHAGRIQQPDAGNEFLFAGKASDILKPRT
jgi:hypothetical protein